MSGRWSGKTWIGPGAAYFVGDARDNDLHAHYALQIAIALQGTFLVKDDSGRQHCATGIIIPSNKRHCIRNDEDQAFEKLMLFIEPASDLGRVLNSHFLLDAECIVDIEPALVEQVIAAADDDEVGESLVRRVVSILTHEAWRYRPVDRRVAFALDYFDHHLSDIDSLAHVAERLSMTPRYLRKLFEREIGLSPQRYRLWCRVKTALTSVLMGESLTDAAASAGFTDSAHFSRTFRGMFGSPPSAVFDDGATVRRVAAPISDERAWRGASVTPIATAMSKRRTSAS